MIVDGISERVDAVNWDRILTVVVVSVTVVPMVIVVGVLLLTEVVGVDVDPYVQQLRGVELPVEPVPILIRVALVAMAVLALAAVYTGVRSLVMAVRIWWNDPVPAGEVRRAGDVVEVQGAAEPALVDTDGGESPINVRTTTRYTNRPGLAYTWEKKRKKRDRGVDDDRGSDTWSTVDEGQDAVPFFVSDDSGRVAVDPGEATLSLKPEMVSKDYTGRYRVRRYEGILQPGDTVHVYGQKRTPVEGDDRFGKGHVYVDGRAGDELHLDDHLGDERVYVGEGDGPFKISDTTELRTVLRSLARGIGYCLLGSGVLGLLAFFALDAL